MPLNPKINFNLDEFKGALREQVDQLRRWFDNYDDNGNVTIQVFDGLLGPQEGKTIPVAGKLYGVIGMTTLLGENPNGFKKDGLPYWIPMETTGSDTNKIYFPSGTGVGSKTEKSFVIYNASTTTSNSYRITAFYKG